MELLDTLFKIKFPNSYRFYFFRLIFYVGSSKHNMSNKPKTGIALSGGGARGFAHLGVIKALNEFGIYPDVISGTSAGAIVGAFVANEFAPETIHEILKDHGVFEYSSFALPNRGLLNLDGLEKLLDTEIGSLDIKDLPKPFYAAAVNLNKGRLKYFNSGNIGDIVRASASIPVLFNPKTIDGDDYVDGGLLDNLPVAPLLNECEQIIGVNLSPFQQMEKIGGISDVASRVFQLSINSTAWNSKNLCHIWIEPEGVNKFDILDNDKADELFQLGYSFTTNLLTTTNILLS